MTRDKTAVRATTVEGHKLRVQAFVKKCGDLPLTEVTRAVASDFLEGLDVKSRTRNNYAQTLKCVFKSAGRRGRFSNAEEDNPFDDQRSKVEGESYEAFTADELKTLFGKLPRETKPVKHTPDTALPWCALIALYTGMRSGEVTGLNVADVRDEGANGATVTVFDLNERTRRLKTRDSARLIPVHSALVRAGLLEAHPLPLNARDLEFCQRLMTSDDGVVKVWEPGASEPSAGCSPQ